MLTSISAGLVRFRKRLQQSIADFRRRRRRSVAAQYAACIFHGAGRMGVSAMRFCPSARAAASNLYLCDPQSSLYTSLQPRGGSLGRHSP